MMHKVSHIKKALLFLRIISVIFLKIYWGTTVMSRTTEMLTKGVEKKNTNPQKPVVIGFIKLTSTLVHQNIFIQNQILHCL